MKSKKLFYSITILLIMFCDLNNAFSQATSAFGGNIPVGADYLGWAGGVPIAVDIRHMGTLDIDFYTGGAAPANKRMTILGTASGTPGFVGIDNGVATGYWSIPPVFQLDVKNDINIHTLHSSPVPANNTYNAGYRINNNLVLYLPGDAPAGGLRNTFVGRSGNIASPQNFDNTYVGFSAGSLSGVNMDKNVFVGVQAGELSTQAAGGTYVGFQAGRNTVGSAGSDFNTFIGAFSGWSDFGSFLNSFVGKESGFSISTGNRNSFLGASAGYSTTDGDSNTFAGFVAGATNTTGVSNSCFGKGADVTQGNLFNASAIGYNTKVTKDNVMLLGNNNIRVGVGLSSNTLGPQSLLHLNDVVSSPAPLPVYAQWTNTTTGVAQIASGLPTGLRIGINKDGFAQIRQETFSQANLPVQIMINSGVAANIASERVIITAGPQQINQTANIPNITRFAIWEIGNTVSPGTQQGVSLLHLGFTATINTFGHRDWMDVGTFANHTRENTYFGLRNNSMIDHNEGIVSWGDDESLTASMRLRFLYTKTSQAAPHNSTSYEGLEFARMWTSDGEYGRMGIGGVPSYQPNPNPYFDCTGDSPDPGNTLEVNSPGSFSSGATGYSGLRFTDLRAGSLPDASNPGAGVLAVDACGDVIYVPDNGIIGFGLCNSGGPTILTDDIGINFSEKNVYFEDPAVPTATNRNAMGIGYNCSISLGAKLDVKSFTRTSAEYYYIHKICGRFYQTGDYEHPPASGTDDMIGVYGESDVMEIQIDNISKRTNLGGDFYASEARTNIGARGTTMGVSYLFNIGLQGNAGYTKINYGVHGIAVPTPGNPFGVLNVGVYGVATPQFIPIPNPVPSVNLAVYGDLFGGAPCVTPPCGTPMTNPDFAGYFNGDLGYTGGIFATSDANLKENIQNLSNPMNIINQLQPKSYSFNHQQNPSMILQAGTHFGLLAQDVYDVLPQLTKDCILPAHYDSIGNETFSAINYKGVNYIELIPFLIAGMKQLDSTNQVQQTQIDSLMEIVGNNELPEQHQGPNENNNNSSNSIDVILASKTIVLNQNEPNPFKENTVIEYFIPDNSENVKIIFTDNKGSVLKIVEILEKGKGQLNVYAADLSSGIYTYTIVANGVTIDTKRMMKTK